ncbi:MAG: ABC transporter permease [Eubacteriales bacterium]
MKMLSTYIKEMKIAFRGFYFYIEVVMAAITLTILLVAVQEYPESNEKEFVFYDMPGEFAYAFFADKITEGTMRYDEPALFKLKAQEFEVISKETGETETFSFEKAEIGAQTVKVYDRETGMLQKTVYMTETAEDMIRLAHSEKKTGIRVFLDSGSTVRYEYYIQGYETERMQNLLYILHSGSPGAIEEAAERQTVRKLGETEVLNSRQNLIPAFVVLMGSMMGFFIVISYVYLDKGEGVIKAFAVTPSTVSEYLLSKAMVIMTTVTLSSSVITIPVMGTQANYPLFYLFLLISTFTFAALGLLVASFFDSLTKAFGVLFGGMMIMLVPMLSYYIPVFDPLWIRFLPTYPLLQGYKEIITVNGDISYVLLYSGIYLAGGLLLFLLACKRFEKTLTV